MSSNEAPRSPTLSASSSTTEDASSEEVLNTPGISDDEDGHDLMLLTPRVCSQRISIRPLCITKTRSLTRQEDEDVHNYLEEEEEKPVPLPVTEEQPECSTEVKMGTEGAEEAEQDFYTHEFEDFISLSPVVSYTTSSARRDSLTLTAEALPTFIDVPAPKPRGRSRHSKPLPLLPPATPPLSTFPLIPTLPLVQTSAQKSIIRRKRTVPSHVNYPPPPSPSESRPLPRVAVPLDIEDSIFPEENFHIPSRALSTTEQVCDVEEGTSIYSPSSFVYNASASTHPLPHAISETPLSGICGKVILPRSSTDSDAPRSSIDSTSSFASSTSSDAPVSPFSFPNSPSSDSELEPTQCLRSRWSSSTLASLAAEPPRTPTILLPLKSVLGSRARRVFIPPPKVPPQIPIHPSKNKHGLPTSQSPLSTLGKHLRRQESRSSTSSAGTSSSECSSHEGSPHGLKRKPIPVSIFLRTN